MTQTPVSQTTTTIPPAVVPQVQTTAADKLKNRNTTKTVPIPTTGVPPISPTTPVTPTTPEQVPENDAAESLKDVGQSIHDWVAKQPTPGGLLLLVLVTLFVLWAIVPVNGRTRLELFWLTLLGKTQLQDTSSSDKPTPTTDVSSTDKPIPTTASGSGEIVKHSANEAYRVPIEREPLIIGDIGSIF